jgi:ribonuclease P protein component
MDGAFCYFTVMAKPFGFGKKEKLKSRKQIDDLFATGKSFAIFPIRVTYKLLPADEQVPLQVAVTASKKNFKKAVERNRIKRLLREAYRLQKAETVELFRQRGQKAHVFFMYTDKTIASFDEIRAAMGKCLKRLQHKIAEVNEDLA